uniref:uncharacterized protein plekhg6 isoform X3 n=1 Tax=Gasterosteus aculeatus aculeatus TaxID=481459 RepID=UPI001A990452|nr:uncharacterized protein plekhg6 isoform X3 [Gasterosteus aculeatus aculeatus]XP_040021619.1 uncharacterized protein plekhg6 isoform X3 [Gasterosteus aculeatus aculeatus]
MTVRNEMDPTKPRTRHVNNDGGNESLMGDPSVPWGNSKDEGREKDADARDSDVDGTTAAAESNHHHRGSADKAKFNTFGYQRRRKVKIVTDLATVSKASAAAKPRAALRQVLFSQGESEKTQASELDGLKQDLDAFAVPLNLNWRWKEESQGTTLEKNWTDIVHSHSTMSKMQRHQQEALWEFVYTELIYINKLMIIKDLVVAALVNLHQHGFLREVTPERLFANIPSILAAHQLFWQEVIYPMLQEVRGTGKPFDPLVLEAGCLQFHERFSSYQHYCWEEENNLKFTRRQMGSNPHFLTYVQWVENHPQCERMRLGDMQVKPHQRITKYPLLLKAALKNTQDPHEQHTLRGMNNTTLLLSPLQLSSVNCFLESINDHLRLKDEKLALSISAQRVEGYEVERINEDIDKRVREICQFDLTCPISGVGPEVVRKLLLEENLKIRERKDSKLEVVALLFSDVLLMTKVQKKGDRLKVVRPPLALDRTFCFSLKDDCSFVVVEVGELRSAMNVYIFVAGTSESCTRWVSNINHAKETLWNLRQTENRRQLENWKIRQLEAKPVTNAETYDMDTEKELLTESRRGSFIDELNEKFIIAQSRNGTLVSKEAEAKERSHPAGGVTENNHVLPLWHSHLDVNSSKLSHKGQQQAEHGYEWIEMGVRADERRGQRVGNHSAQSAPDLDCVSHGIAADPSRNNTTGPHDTILYPDVDYPTEEESTPDLPAQLAIFRGESAFIRLTQGRRMATNRDSDSHAVDQDSRINSDYSKTGDMETPAEAWGCSKNLKSPGIRRRRQNSSHQGPSSQMSNQSLPVLNGQMKRNSQPSVQESHRVLKLGSLKNNQAMFADMHGRVSPDPQTLSESELSDHNIYNRGKTRRTASIHNMKDINKGQGATWTSSPHTLPKVENALFPKPSGHNVALEGLLVRAKERDGLKSRNVKRANSGLRNPPPPSFSPASSPSPSDRESYMGWEEEEVELFRHRALTVSKGWKEQLVDGDEDDKRNFKN